MSNVILTLHKYECRRITIFSGGVVNANRERLLSNKAIASNLYDLSRSVDSLSIYSNDRHLFLFYLRKILLPVIGSSYYIRDYTIESKLKFPALYWNSMIPDNERILAVMRLVYPEYIYTFNDLNKFHEILGYMYDTVKSSNVGGLDEVFSYLVYSGTSSTRNAFYEVLK